MPMDETPVLIAQAGPLNGQQWLITGDLLVGRDASCNIVVPDRQVSRHHARVSNQPDGFYLEDLRSKNGTHVNGLQVDPGIYLNDGDVVQIALAQEFVFVSADSTIPLDEKAHFDSAPLNALRLERRSRRVWIGDRELSPSLSVAQFRVLEVLYTEQGRVVTRDRLTEEVWGVEGAVEVSDQALDALIRRLRRRLSDVDPEHEYILTVRGHGLRLDNPERG